MNIKGLASDLIDIFFIQLTENKIRYAVLRNYESLPEANDSKDVDILVSPCDFNNTILLLTENAQQLGYQLIWKNELDYLFGFVFVKIVDDTIFSIKFDVFYGFKWRGLYYIDHDIILKNAMKYNGFQVPKKAHESFIMIVYYVLYAKSIKSKYVVPIYNNAIENITEFIEIVNLTFKEPLSNDIVRLIKNNRINELITLRKEIKREVIKYNIKQKPIFRNFIKHFKTEVFYRNKMGVLLAFSGPDGAGKSTLLDNFIKLIVDLGICKNKIPYHFLSNKIPSLHKIPGAPKKYKNQDYTKPYQAKPAGFLSSLIRVTYYFIAFYSDRLFFLSNELRSNRIVIFDRYYTDMIVDPVRMRISLKRKWVQNFFKFLPQPNFSFIIIANPEQIVSRKDELTKEKVLELLREYKNLTKVIPNIQIIENKKSLEKGELELFKKVFNSLEISYK